MRRGVSAERVGKGNVANQSAVFLCSHQLGRRARYDAKGSLTSSNAVQEEVRRLEDKSLDGQLLWEQLSSQPAYPGADKSGKRAHD